VIAVYGGESCRSTAFSLLVLTERPHPTRLFLKKSRTSLPCPVQSGSENALEHYLAGELDNAPLPAAGNLSERSREPVQLGTERVPLGVIEGVIHIPA
jgi:hypothetical protein